MTSPAPAATPASAENGEPVHGCVRCGAPIPVHESMCESCNPLGLKAPAASQAHGTVFVGIVIAVLVMAVVGRLLIADVGPFTSALGGVATDPGGLRVTISVTNHGASAGATTCRIDDPTTGGISPNAAYAESPRVPPGGSATFDVIVGGFGKEPRVLSVDCGS